MSHAVDGFAVVVFPRHSHGCPLRTRDGRGRSCRHGRALSLLVVRGAYERIGDQTKRRGDQVLAAGEQADVADRGQARLLIFSASRRSCSSAQLDRLSGPWLDLGRCMTGPSNWPQAERWLASLAPSAGRRRHPSAAAPGPPLPSPHSWSVESAAVDWGRQHISPAFLPVRSSSAQSVGVWGARWPAYGRANGFSNGCPRQPCFAVRH
jgi:hypothetical protein